MERICILNSSGGAAKTSSAVNLASCLAKRSRRVLLVDLDGQGTASTWLGQKSNENQSNLLEGLLGERKAEDCISDTPQDDLFLMGSSYHLYNAEKFLANEIEPHTLLNLLLNQIEDEYDYAVLDTPPQLSALVYNGILAAPRNLIIPAEASFKCLSAMRALIRVVEQLKQRRSENIEITGILATRVDKRTKSAKEAVEYLRESFGEIVFKTEITEAVAMKDAPGFNQSVLDYKPKSQSAKQIREFTEEVLGRIESKERRENAA